MNPLRFKTVLPGSMSRKGKAAPAIPALSQRFFRTDYSTSPCFEHSSASKRRATRQCWGFVTGCDRLTSIYKIAPSTGDRIKGEKDNDKILLYLKREFCSVFLTKA